MGLAGLLYWYALYPFYGLIFSSMIKHIAEDAREQNRTLNLQMEMGEEMYS